MGALVASLAVTIGKFVRRIPYAICGREKCMAEANGWDPCTDAGRIESLVGTLYSARLNGEEEEDGSREWRSGRAYVPDFWSRSMIFPKRTNEGGGLRWQTGSHRAGRCGCVFSSLILFPCAQFDSFKCLMRKLHSRVARSHVSIESAAEEACANTAHKWVLTLSDIAV
ncbi:hypothetical protein ALC57_06992 [Trachymyrmex cornetzi]|uniref:Uncharacterized protein n=1 Tax=Trachymyrmex cornetzi TaxID=471704 RepID=A0A195E651_9HYME|nr:hypothetical protein ALC57_06992 [Trachymyrmex cornetzi]